MMIKPIRETVARGRLCPFTFASSREAGPGSGEVFGCWASRCMWWVESGSEPDPGHTGAVRSIGFCGGMPGALAESTGLVERLIDRMQQLTDPWSRGGSL